MGSLLIESSLLLPCFKPQTILPALSITLARNHELEDYSFLTCLGIYSCFGIDNVFAPYDQNHKIYDGSAKRLVRRVMQGYHGTVFAYGMTGTGKTFSMQGTATSPGVIPLAITDIFSFIRETPHREFLLRVSYLEIYNEKIHDLLNPAMEAGVGPGAPQPEEIKLREDPKRGVFASPLKEEIVQSPTQLLRVIARGDQSRRTRSTQFNAQSSRSHAVVQIVVESRERPFKAKGQIEKRAPLVPGGVRVSTLSMIDLAGSERAADDKERRTEGAHINKSLLTLGTVIARLSGDKDSAGNPTDKDGKHLPYRDSKLTRLLQPALSGDSLVSILCTIQLGSQGSVLNTANAHTGETLNTLKFAARAKNNIVSHAKKAEEALGSGTDAGSRVLLERYRMEIQSLRSELENQKKSQDEKRPESNEKPLEEEERQFEKAAEQRREEQMLEMQLARTALNDRIEHLNRLILSSKSSGVNASGKMSSLSMHPSSPMHGKSEGSIRTLQSLRSSASHSTLGGPRQSLARTVSVGSTVTAPGQGNTEKSPISSLDDDEDSRGEFGNGTATSRAQIQALQADLADKNRYISTLEQRLIQARRSSQPRISVLVSPTSPNRFSSLEEQPSEVTHHTANLLKEKDTEIAELRARLDDKDRMVDALRAAARHRDVADLASEPTSPNIRGESSRHQSNDSKDSAATGSGSNGAAAHTSPVSPVQLLSPQKGEKEKELKRKSIDAMTRILDGMIEERVQTGGLVIGSNGIVRAVHERRKESMGAVPNVGALAAQLRPQSTVSEGGV
jgi:centromeric protein E